MISNQYPPDFLGGDAVFCRTLSEGLVEMDWEVNVMSNPYGYSLVTGNKAKKEKHYGLDGVKVTPAKYNFFKLVRNQIGYFTDNRDEIRKIEKIDPDIIHLHNFSSFGIKFLKKLKKKFEKPIVMTVHDNWLICPFRKREMENCRTGCIGCSYNKYKLPISFPREYIRYIDKLIFPSRFYQKLFKDHFSSLPSNKVIQNFTKDWAKEFDFKKKEKLKEELGIQEDKIVILFVGHLIKEKGVDKLIEISNNRDDCVFLFVGEDKDDLLKETSHEEKENIRYFGFLPSFSKELYQLYHISDLFLLPTRWENCPLTVIEAMSFGLPVIATDVGGIPELVEHEINGYLFGLDEFSKLDDILEKILNKYYLDEMGQISREKFEVQFTVERGIKKYTDTYGELI